MKLSVKMEVRKTWWFNAFMWVIVFGASIRLLPIGLGEKALNYALPYSHKYRVGKGKWKRLEVTEVTFSLQRDGVK